MTPSYVTTAKVDKLLEKSGEYCANVIATNLFEEGIDSTPELKKTGVNGRPFEILTKKVARKEQAEKRAKALAERRAARRTAQAPSTRRHKSSVVAQGGRYGLPKDAKRYSVSQLDAIVAKVGSEMGCSPTEIREMIYIFHRESLDNTAIGGSGNHFCGMWQLHYTMANGNPWWDPYWETKRAIRYMRGHAYQRFGKGIHAAYLHKKAYGWY